MQGTRACSGWRARCSASSCCSGCGLTASVPSMPARRVGWGRHALTCTMQPCASLAWRRYAPASWRARRLSVPAEACSRLPPCLLPRRCAPRGGCVSSWHPCPTRGAASCSCAAAPAGGHSRRVGVRAQWQGTRAASRGSTLKCAELRPRTRLLPHCSARLSRTVGFASTPAGKETLVKATCCFRWTTLCWGCVRPSYAPCHRPCMVSRRACSAAAAQRSGACLQRRVAGGGRCAAHTAGTGARRHLLATHAAC